MQSIIDIQAELKDVKSKLPSQNLLIPAFKIVNNSGKPGEGEKGEGEGETKLSDIVEIKWSFRYDYINAKGGRFINQVYPA